MQSNIWIRSRSTSTGHARLYYEKKNKYKRRSHTFDSHTQIFLHKKYSLSQNSPRRSSHRPANIRILDASRCFLWSEPLHHASPQLLCLTLCSTPNPLLMLCKVYSICYAYLELYQIPFDSCTSLHSIDASTHGSLPCVLHIFGSVHPQSL